MSFLSVKGIFKTLIGTVVLMVVVSLVIEMINMSISSIQMTQMAKIACRQSAVLLSQETYKQRLGADGSGGSEGTTFMADVQNIDDVKYIGGDYYPGSDARSIYDAMYKNNNDFKNWVKSSEIAGNWDSIELISLGLWHQRNSIGDEYAPDMPSSMDEASLKRYTRSITADAYVDVMMTPLNMGVPYLDKATLQKIFQWNLASIASDCNSDRIRPDESGNYCIYYNGFRVYADQAEIKNLVYKTYDLSDGADLEKFKYDTGIISNVGQTIDDLGFLGGADLGSSIGEDERKKICVVGIEYDIPIAYEGITPIRKIFDFIWDTEVAGFARQETGDTGFEGRDVHRSWSDTTATLHSGGFTGQAGTSGDENKAAQAGVLPVPGRLIYYIVR